MEPLEIGSAPASRTYNVDGLERSGKVAFLAESLDGADIDLELRAPNGSLMPDDRADDRHPVVFAKASTRGVLTIHALNPAGLKAAVNLKVWKFAHV
jgi:hypothetical protein